MRSGFSLLRDRWSARKTTAKLVLTVGPELLGALDRLCARSGGITREQAAQLLIRDALLDFDFAWPVEETEPIEAERLEGSRLEPRRHAA